MRQITAAEVKPGMTIRWEGEMKVEDTAGPNPNGDVLVWSKGKANTELLDANTSVTVLKEVQPEEPTGIGARVAVGEWRFLRTNDGELSWRRFRPDGAGAMEHESWDEVCAYGPVTVIDADPSWTAPAQVKVAPVVPERIEEWPEDDTALRPYKWRGRDGYIWKWLAAASEWECYDAVGNGMVSGGRPSYGPWTHATDA